MIYTQVAAGSGHTVLLRSDGVVVACGSNADGKCNIPPLDGGVTYTQEARRPHVILQATFRKFADSTVMQLCFLSGEECIRVDILPTDIISEVIARLGCDLGHRCPPDVLLPNGELLSQLKSATFASFFSEIEFSEGQGRDLAAIGGSAPAGSAAPPAAGGTVAS